MAQEFHFQHHRLEASKNRLRMSFALISIFVATVTIGTQQYLGYSASITSKVNDATIGTGLNQFEFSGSWVKDMSATAYQSDNHFGNSLGIFYRVRFSGTQIKIYSEKSVGLGIYGVSIDGGAETLVDPYSANRVEQQLLYTSPVLVNGGHNVKVRRTGNKNASANATYISADRVDVISPGATPTPTPTPTPIPPTPPPVIVQKTPTPVPATPKPTVNPAIRPTATPAPVQSVQLSTPTAPGSFQAVVTGDNAVVVLSWSASTASTGVLGYRLERSSDGGNTWNVLTSANPGLGYTDDAAAFAVHYTYRVSAVGQSGTNSEFAQVDATTGNFKSSDVATKAETFSSDDKLAKAEVQAGALATDANCSILTQEIRLGTSERKVVAGPYTLVCKEASGKVLSEFSQPVRWAVNLKGRLGGVKNPEAANVNSTGAAASIPGSVFDTKTQVVHFNQSSASQVAVLADTRHGLGLGWLIALILALIGGAGFIVLLRTHQIERYHDYLLEKYYNL